jgi:antitoxin component YwqK of YwqJK toxin-antitoxin module
VVVPRGFEPTPGEERTGYDLDHDGRPDVWSYSVKDAAGKELLLRKEKDLNGDGRLDSWEKYGPDGRLSEAMHDLDLDGTPDEALFYERGELVMKELARGFGGVPPTRSFHEGGKLVRKERDTNGDSRVDTWEYWENGELDRIGVDQDGDGQVDRWDARRSAAPGQK